MHLKNDLINKLKTCAKQLTHGAVKLLIFLAKNCDDTGYVRGVYYKEFCDLTKMCNQSFYNSKSKLIELGFISCEKSAERDIDFYIIDNSIITPEERKEGYVPFDTIFFENPDIFQLTDNALILALEFFKNSGANKSVKKPSSASSDNTVRFGSFRKDWREFVNYYCQDVFDVCEVQFKNYLKSLKKYFTMGVKEKVFFATPMVDSVKKYRNSSVTSVDKKIAFRIAKVALARFGLNYNKKKKQLNYVIDNLGELILQYKSYAIAIFSNSSNATGKRNSDSRFVEIASVLEKALRYTIKCEKKGEWEDFLSGNIKFLHQNIRHNLGLV